MPTSAKSAFTVLPHRAFPMVNFVLQSNSTGCRSSPSHHRLWQSMPEKGQTIALRVGAKGSHARAKHSRRRTQSCILMQMQLTTMVSIIFLSLRL